ncbi:hypothetical protein ACFL3T_04140 [Patescibacteria group bacterium]
MQPRAEKPRYGSKSIIEVFSAQTFARIEELFDIKITSEEVRTFAEANDCFEDAVPLAEHICLVMIEAVQNQQARIFGLKDGLRLKIAQVIAVTEPKAFDGLYIPQKERDQKLYGLAVQFLNGKI